MIHLTIQQISSYRDGELNPSSADLVRQHLESCEACASKRSRLEAQGEELANALRSDPGEAFFDRIADEIEQRIRSGKPAAAAVAVAAPSAPASEPAAASPAPVAPERKQTEPVADALPVGSGPEAVRPDPERRRHDHPRRGRSGHPAPWVVAALITVVAVSAGVMISSIGHQAPSPVEEEVKGSIETGVAATPPSTTQWVEPSSEPSPQAPPKVETIEPTPTTTPADRRPVPPAAPEPPNLDTTPAGEAPAEDSDFVPVMTRADEVIGDLPARRPAEASRVSVPPRAGTSAEAGGARSAPAAASGSSAAATPPPAVAPPRPQTADQYDAAAAYWEEQLPQLRGDEYRAVRYRLAEARYHAWRTAPNGDRAARAEAAIRAYLVTARKGPQRESATRWLSAVEEAGFR